MIGYNVCFTEEAVMADLTDDTQRAILLAATLLTGHKRRQFQAEMARRRAGMKDRNDYDIGCPLCWAPPTSPARTSTSGANQQ